MVAVLRRDCDSGFTLTELVIVLALMGFILSVAYGLFNLTRTGTNLSNREAWMSREVAGPLDFAERVLSQQLRFDYSGTGVNRYRCAFYTQRGGSASGNQEQRYVIEVPSDPNDNRLLVTLDHGGGAVPASWSDANFNRAAGVPLFTYLDQDGEPIETMDSQSLTMARSVIITIVTEHEGQRFEDSRRVFFRNR